MANSMVHWNGCHLVAIDTETTGLDPHYHEIVQICLLPLDSNIQVRKDVLPFYIKMKPEHPERIDDQAMRINKLDPSDLEARGIDKVRAIDLLEAWIDKLGLPHNKSGYNRCKIIPLGHNYAFDMAFIKRWLGVPQYEEWFHYHYKDSMLAANYLNDCHAMKAEEVPFPHIGLTHCCKKLSVPTDRAHDALQDCLHCAEVYRKLITVRGVLI